MFPVMEGGVFWEHSHRLVAGGLVLLWTLATILLSREPSSQPWAVRAAGMGIGLLLIQAVFGGLTVIFLLPAWISSTHLLLAYLFLGLAVLIQAASGANWSTSDGLGWLDRAALHSGARVGATLVLLQSLLGAFVRHTDAGMACGRELATCRGGIIPATFEAGTLLHFSHRVLGIIVALWIFRAGLRALRSIGAPHVRKLHRWAITLVVVQIALGYLSVSEYLGMVPVSLHTVGASLTFAVLVAAAAHTRERSAAV